MIFLLPAEHFLCHLSILQVPVHKIRCRIRDSRKQAFQGKAAARAGAYSSRTEIWGCYLVGEVGEQLLLVLRACLPSAWRYLEGLGWGGRTFSNHLGLLPASPPASCPPCIAGHQTATCSFSGTPPPLTLLGEPPWLLSLGFICFVASARRV